LIVILSLVLVCINSLFYMFFSCWFLSFSDFDYKW
jgi:hypothetical protein